MDGPIRQPTYVMPNGGPKPRMPNITPLRPSRPLPFKLAFRPRSRPLPGDPSQHLVPMARLVSFSSVQSIFSLCFKGVDLEWADRQMGNSLLMLCQSGELSTSTRHPIAILLAVLYSPYFTCMVQRSYIKPVANFTSRRS